MIPYPDGNISLALRSRLVSREKSIPLFKPTLLRGTASFWGQTLTEKVWIHFSHLW